MSDTKNWVEILADEVDTLLADPKVVKFSTHKNRKVFSGKLRSLIKEAIFKNTGHPHHKVQNDVIKIRPDVQPTHTTVMTESLSGAGDDISKTNKNKYRLW